MVNDIMLKLKEFSYYNDNAPNIIVLPNMGFYNLLNDKRVFEHFKIENGKQYFDNVEIIQACISEIKIGYVEGLK